MYRARTAKQAALPITSAFLIGTLTVNGFVTSPRLLTIRYHRPSVIKMNSAFKMPLEQRVCKQIRGGALPSTAALLTASFLPTALGLWKTGYAVSYGYGGAMLVAAALYLRNAAAVSVAKWHALALLFYGLRLNLFLLYRELALDPEIHGMTARAATFNERLRRVPLICCCAMLYFGMAAPLRATALGGNTATWGSSIAITIAVAATWLGFLLAAVGDLIKSYVKSKRGPKYLVTCWPFDRLRHPNYTGECFGWTASFFAAIFATLSGSAPLSWLVWSVAGWIGILFVLAREAAPVLEMKQKERYGDSSEYISWVKKTWAGPMLQTRQPVAEEGTTEK